MHLALVADLGTGLANVHPMSGEQLALRAGGQAAQEAFRLQVI